VALRSSVLNVKSKLKNEERVRLMEINKNLNYKLSIKLHWLPLDKAEEIKRDIASLIDDRNGQSGLMRVKSPPNTF